MYLNGYIEKNEFYEKIDDKLKSLGISEYSYPLDPFKIVEAYKGKIEIDLRPFPSLNLGGLLYKDPEDKLSIIGINSLKSRKAQNFDCMHELIHYWFHPPGNHLCYDNNFILQNKNIEWQSNEGAAQALMPELLFKKRYIQFGGDITRLSDLFSVSSTAVKYRVENLKLPSVLELRKLLYKSKKARHCLECGSADVTYSDNYCKICGNDCFCFGTGYKWSTYSEGPDIRNICPECGLTLDNNARYCKRCGVPSTSNWILEPWYVELKIFEVTSISL